MRNVEAAEGSPYVPLLTGMVEEHGYREHIAVEDMALQHRDRGHRHRRVRRGRSVMRPGVARSLGASVLCIPLLGACAETAAQDFCTQYEELVAAAAELREQDPVTAKAEDLRTQAEAFGAELDQFQAVSEGRLDQAISRLRADINAVRQAAADTGTEAVEVARPLIEDAMEQVNEAWILVQSLAETQCPNEG